MATGTPAVKQRVSYFYDCEIGNYSYGPGHSMKPHRVRMAHDLIMSYGLYPKLEVFKPALLDHTELTRFHTDDYINFLRVISPDNKGDYVREMHKFNVGEDCPVFDGLYEFCVLSTSGSMGGAARLNSGDSDVVVNWGGGLHHAKKCEASGFCYVNDCVLAILELLKKHERVLYIDIDIHHGDGVEEAFYTTDRVMTCSFHKYADGFFPGTGDVKDCGFGSGKNYAINFPLLDGMTDDGYASIFEPIVGAIMSRYRPGAVVLQCGADSLAGDKLGSFNLTTHGHAACVAFVKKFNLPTLVLGGGGYTMRNVARCWANETAVLLGETLPEKLPFSTYYDYYGPDHKLHVPATNMENKNTAARLEEVKVQLFEYLRGLEPAPGAPIHTGATDAIPPAYQEDKKVEDDPDVRESATAKDARVAHPARHYEDAKDVDKTDGKEHDGDVDMGRDTAAAAPAAGAGAGAGASA